MLAYVVKNTQTHLHTRTKQTHTYTNTHTYIYIHAHICKTTRSHTHTITLIDRLTHSCSFIYSLARLLTPHSLAHTITHSNFLNYNCR